MDLESGDSLRQCVSQVMTGNGRCIAFHLVTQTAPGEGRAQSDPTGPA